MKNRFIALVICWMFISIGNATQHISNEIPLIISNAEELRAFAKSVNAGNSYRGKMVKLSHDIWLNDTIGWQEWNRKEMKVRVWIPIGNDNHPFEGTFDGEGHFIAGLFTKAGSETFYQGLFGYLKRATVKNVHIRFSHIIAYNFVGGIAGYISLNSLILNCSNAGIIENDRNYTGGIIGFSEGLNRIIGCSNMAKVYGHRCVGGIAGYFEGGSIYNSFNRGEIIARYEHVGGIVGEYSEPYMKEVDGTGLKSLPNDTLANCYNTGTIYGRDVVGGIAGHISLYTDEVTGLKVIFSNNYSTGKLVTNYPVVTDGLVGAYTYFPDAKNLIIPTIRRIERDSKPCYWSEEACKLVAMDKPRFEGSLIRSNSWNKVCYGITTIPRMFKYFPEKEMAKQDFVDLLNEFVGDNTPFNRWRVDSVGENKGFPIFIK